MPAPGGASALSLLPDLSLRSTPSSSNGRRLSSPTPLECLAVGVAMIEVCKGAYASPPRPLLVVDDADLAAEVRQLVMMYPHIPSFECALTTPDSFLPQ